MASVVGVFVAYARRRSVLAALARQAVGPYGALLVDASLAALMFGVVVAYLVAFHDFASQTPARAWTARRHDVFLAAALAAPVACVRDIGRLAAAGAVGLVQRPTTGRN